jgi:hypothetical protein
MRIAYISVAVFLVSQLVATACVVLLGVSHADLCRWDCNWYRLILERGYDAEPSVGIRDEFANWAFFPALPVIGHIVNSFADSGSSLALIIVGRASFALSIFAFVHFTMAWRPSINPWVSAAVVSFQPYAIYGNVGYTEPLFMAVTCATLVFARHGRVVLAGITAGLSTFVRFPAISLGPAIAVRFWLPRVLAGKLPSPREIVGVMLAPLGLALFSAFLDARVGDGLAFFRALRAWNRSSFNPVGPLGSGLLDGVTTVMHLPEVFASEAPASMLRELGAHRAYYAVTAVLAIWAIPVLVRRGEFDLATFAFGATLTPLATNLASMPRYVWWQAPFLLCVVSLMSTNRWAAAAFCCAALVMTPVTYLGWFSEYAFVT